MSRFKERVHDNYRCGQDDHIWDMCDGDLNETYEVFINQFNELINKINTYWYGGLNKEQAMNIIKQVMDKKLKGVKIK